jgi:NADPH-dependent 2,4-dienoyl-CoA reductase/sulfur reductase-like enzyme
MSRRRYLILGDGAAGTSAAEHLRRCDPEGQVAIYSDDPHPAYFRAALTNYLLGELTEAQLWAVPPNFYQEQQVYRVMARVAGVDAHRKEVHFAGGGAPLGYDALLVATGSRARTAPFAGAELPGVMTMRTLQDARVMMDLMRSGSLGRAVVVGGGPLGLEWAQGLQLRGIQVTLLMREHRFLPGALDDVGSDLLLARLRQSGVEVGLGEEIHGALAGGDGRLGAVVTKSGHTLPCELAGVAIGVVCNTDFLQSSGVALGKSRGVVVDDRMRASVPGVYAAGDVVEHQGRTLQLWEPARQQARVAAHNMTGHDLVYRPGAHYLATRLYDLDFASVGDVTSTAAESVVDLPRRTGRISYRKVLVHEGRIIGALMIGEREERVRQRGRTFKRFIDEAIDVRSIKDKLLDPTFDLNGWSRSRTILQKPMPSATGAMAAAPPAQMRKTQALRVAAPASSPASLAPASLAAPASVQELGYLEGRGKRFSLSQELTSIGRDPRSGIALDDPGVSGLHAQITRYQGALYVRDAGSRNGTWVNRTQVTVPHRLTNGDRVLIGNTELVFVSTAPPASAPHPSYVAPSRPPQNMAAPPPASAAPVPLAPTALPTYCVGCGQPLTAGAAFCTACGFRAASGARR